MTITISWWIWPLLFLIGYVGFGIDHARRSNPFDLVPGLLSLSCLIVAVAFIAGHYA